MTVKLTCAACSAPKSYTGYTQRSIIDAVRSQGGAITRDNVYYCPTCAPNYRHVGRGGKPLSLPPGCEQIKIENLG